MVEFDSARIKVTLITRKKGHVFSDITYKLATMPKEKGIELYKKYSHELLDNEVI